MCFLCNKALDGWEEGDDPVEEHLKHSPTCGWAIMAAIEDNYGNYGKVHPLDPAMIEARKATFAGRWPYESKKGFKCKTKKVGALQSVCSNDGANLLGRSWSRQAGNTRHSPTRMTW